VKIVDAVKGRITIGFDSGIRCGADMYARPVSSYLSRLTCYSFKALALGADFVQIGRPIIYGLAHDGEKGVRHVLKAMLADFDLNTGLSGRRGIMDIDRSCLEENRIRKARVNS
jgi:lactate 2-monooxygenase